MKQYFMYDSQILLTFQIREEDEFVILNEIQEAIYFGNELYFLNI